jgi:predicted XRE-type DNA-binding protein
MVPTRRTKTDSAKAVETSSGNVFADLGLPDADARLTRAELARAIRLVVKKRDWTQKHTARVLGIAAPDVWDLMRGKLARFSQERLERFLTALDMDVEIRVRRRRPGKPRATVTVQLLSV